MKEEDYWDQTILREWVRRFPNKATMKALISALQEAELKPLAQYLRNTKIFNSQKTKLSNTFLDDMKTYKVFIREEKSIVTQLIPYGALEDTFQSETKRDKDITKLHVNRRYINLLDRSTVTDLEELLVENNSITLVRGPAGIGKTTLFQYCMVKWAREELFRKYDMMLAFSCRDIKEGSIGSVQDVVFECSIIGDSGVDAKYNFTMDQMEKLGEECRLLILADGADEISIPGDQRQIKEMRIKVEKAMKNPSIVLNGQEIVVGFLSGIFLKGCQVLLTGRNSTIFQKNIPSNEIRIDENEVIVLKQERLSTASNYEIYELEDNDLKILSHNLLCPENTIHSEGNDDICSQVYTNLVNIEVMKSFRRIPCFAKWLIQLINFFLVHNENYDLNLKNITTIMVNLILGRLREHSGMNYKDVESFCQLLESPQTSNLGKGLQALTKISFMEMMNNRINIVGTIKKNDDIEYINVGEEYIEVHALKKLELMKMSRSVHRKILLTAEHLTLLEILSSANFCCLPVDKWPGIMKEMPKERLLMVLWFAAGLLGNADNDLIQDFMKLISNGSYKPGEKIQQLYRVVLTTNEDEIPSTSINDYVPITFKNAFRNKTGISAKRLSLLSLLVRESGININSEILWKNLPEKTKAPVEDTLIMTVKSASHEMSNTSQLTVSMTGLTKLTSSAHYHSLIFLETMTTSAVIYQIEELWCQSYLPPETLPSKMAGVTSGTGLFWLDEYEGDVSGLLEVVSRCKPNSNKSMQEIWLTHTNIKSVPPATLASVFTSYGCVWLSGVSLPGDVWGILAMGRGEGGLGRMEVLWLSNVDMRDAPSEALAWVLASIKKVVLGGTTRLSDELWTILAERRGEEGLGRMEELRLKNVDMRKAPSDALAWVLAAMKRVQLIGTTRLSDELWSILAERCGEGELDRMEGLELWNVDMREAPSKALSLVLASMKRVELRGTSTRLSDDQWSVWANHMEVKYRNNNPVTEEVKIDGLVEAPKEHLDTIKSYLKPS